jgi:hypothetical protein
MPIRTIYHFTTYKGGASNALDSVDGDKLLDRDRAFVVVSLSSTTARAVVYNLNATSGAAETVDDPPSVVQPDSNAGTKRWIKCTWG